MKKILFLLAYTALLFGCEKTIEDIFGNEFPPLPNPTDACSGMEDEIFIKYCLENFDKNNDGKISRVEADAVTEIDLRGHYEYSRGLKIVTLKGIEYFANLKSLKCTLCDYLETVDLSYNTKIETIQNQALAFCENLTDIILPNSVAAIEIDAFHGCLNMTHITIPNTVTSIGEMAFYNCGLTEITIPNGIDAIKESTFGHCKDLKKIIIPNTVTSIGDSAFCLCI